MFSCPDCMVEHSDGVKCSKCSTYYCFSCANITEKNYRKLGASRQAALLCPICKTSQPQVMSVASPVAQPSLTPNATLDLVLQELRDGIKGINVRLEQLPTLVQEVKDIREKFHHFEGSMLDIKNEVNVNKVKTMEMETRLSTLESRCGDDANYPQFESRLAQLTSDLSSKEQRERINNVEIKGLPLKKNENLIALVCKLGETIGQPVVPADIDFVIRARSSNNIKPVIVGFLGRYKKENFVASARSHKKLTAEDLGFSGVASRIFVNDHLTRENKQLLTKTKKLALEKDYKYTWVQNCKILVRKNDTSPIISVSNDGDLSKIK